MLDTATGLAFSLLVIFADVYCVPMSGVEKELMLDLHNKARREVTNAADMVELVWDDSLERDAQRFADTCPTDHASGIDQGENLAWGWPSRTVADAMNGWVEEERPYFDYYRRNWCNGGVCGHYTQIIWAKTGRLGCARQSRICDNMAENGQAGDVYVCRYKRQGNIRGQRPFTIGTQCTGCSGQNNECNNGLCSTSSRSSGTTATTGTPADGCPDGQRLFADTEANGIYDQLCDLPFTYKGIDYQECTTQDLNQPWCPLTSTSPGAWGICSCVDDGSSTTSPSTDPSNVSTDPTSGTTPLTTNMTTQHTGPATCTPCVCPEPQVQVIYETNGGDQWKQTFPNVVLLMFALAANRY